MALLAKDKPCQISTPAPPFNSDYSEFRAGEAIEAGDALTLKSDGKLWKATGVAANADARVFCWAAEDARVNNPVTGFDNVNFHYGVGLTPGTRYYLSATAGRLDTVASTGGTVPVAVAIDDRRIRVFASWMRQ